ncbi:cytochrome P450 [Nocardia sp. NBC_01503]|uniref:cytochrome P450 n=1 Tax=Nocardia sp. NBC_01503 TaxID=2975997 RepID=UPI002E7C14C7|nr:cytochrome P450 [Nocardia sp. NBC_01503]WTL34883.1 cytochrome P450 [Nocardia sp. NBC_01503]
MPVRSAAGFSHRRLSEIPRHRPVDRLLDRLPLRPAPLATPPAGSALLPVPGARGVPLIGLLPAFVRYGPALQLAMFRRFGPVSWFGGLGVKLVTAGGGDAAQAVLTNRDKAFETGWDMLDPLFIGGLTRMNGEEHRRHRRMSQPAFGAEAVAGYLRPMTRAIAAEIAAWPTDRPLLMRDATRALSAAVSSEAFLAQPAGAGGRATMAAIQRFVNAQTAVLRLPIPGTTWWSGLRARRYLLDRFRKAVPAARARAGDDFLAVLSRATDDSGTGFTDDELAMHLLHTVFASHDTTGSALTAAVYFLGKHPEWQDRCRAEARGRGSAELSIAELRRSILLDRVIRESIRLVVPAPEQLRMTVKDTELLGHFIPAGTLVAVAPLVNHMMPEYWPNPERFDPDRFAPQRREDRAHRGAWLPFGGGHHKCIGMDFGMLKVVASLDAMLRNFEWELPAEYEMSWSYAELGPMDGLPVRLRRL